MQDWDGCDMDETKKKKNASKQASRRRKEPSERTWMCAMSFSLQHALTTRKRWSFLTDTMQSSMTPPLALVSTDSLVEPTEMRNTQHATRMRTRKLMRITSQGACNVRTVKKLGKLREVCESEGVRACVSVYDVNVRGAFLTSATQRRSMNSARFSPVIRIWPMCETSKMLRQQQHCGKKKKKKGKKMNECSMRACMKMRVRPSITCEMDIRQRCQHHRVDVLFFCQESVACAVNKKPSPETITFCVHSQTATDLALERQCMCDLMIDSLYCTGSR